MVYYAFKSNLLKSAAALAFVQISALQSLQAQLLQPFDSLVFPQIAQGRFGQIGFETTLNIVNPNLESAEVEVLAYGFQPERTSLSLQPWELRQVHFSGEDPRTGSIRIRGERELAAVARVSIELDGQLISRVSLPPQRPILKAAMPVFRNTAAVDDTAIAVLFDGPGFFRLILRDQSGIEVTNRRLANPAHCIVGPGGGTPEEDIIKGDRAVFMLGELFPDLPPEFTQGHILMQFEGDQPSSFAVQGIYLQGTEFRPAPVQAISKDVQFTVSFHDDEVDVESMAAELAAEYSLTISDIATYAKLVVVLTTPETAKVIARKPDVRSVSPNTLICFFP